MNIINFYCTATLMFFISIAVFAQQESNFEDLEKKLNDISVEVSNLKAKIENIEKLLKENLPRVSQDVKNQPDIKNKNSAAEKKETSKRCQAITKKGTQCSRNAKPGSNFCWQHGG